MYDPSIGRWLEEDPEGFAAGDSNLYRYVNNQPTDRTDPSGLREADDRRTPFTAGLVDVKRILENHVNSTIAAARARFPHASFGDAAGGRAITEYVYEQLGANRLNSGINGGNMSQLTQIEWWLETSLNPSQSQRYRYTYAGSRYGGNPIGAGPRTPLAYWRQEYADHMIASTININGTLMGTDKWGHFFQQGYWSYASGLSDNESVAFGLWMEGDREAFVRFLGAGDVLRGARLYDAANTRFAGIMHRFGTPVIQSMSGIFGSESTGVVSTADQDANAMGRLFYQQLAADPYRYTFRVNDFPVRQMNEQANPNQYAYGITPNDRRLPAAGTPSQ